MAKIIEISEKKLNEMVSSIGNVIHILKESPEFRGKQIAIRVLKLLIAVLKDLNV